MVRADTHTKLALALKVLIGDAGPSPLRLRAVAPVITGLPEDAFVVANYGENSATCGRTLWWRVVTPIQGLRRSWQSALSAFVPKLHDESPSLADGADAGKRQSEATARRVKACIEAYKGRPTDGLERIAAMDVSDRPWGMARLAMK